MTVVQNTSASPRPTLRLFVSEETSAEVPTGESPEMTLVQFFEQAFVPLSATPRGLKAESIDLMRDSLAHWKRITHDPPLDQIDDYTTAAFVAGLQQLPGRKREKVSAQTVIRHCQSIQQVLDFAGPKTRDRRGRKNRQLIVDPPLIDRPTADRLVPTGDFTLEEILAIQGAVSRVRSPYHLLPAVTPAAWWQALIVVAASTGLRIGELMRLRYQDLHGQEIHVRAETAKGRKAKRQYLSSDAIAEIEAIRTDRERIFDFPNWDRNPRWIQVVWKKLLTAAGIPKQRQFGFHGLRKFHATAIFNASSGSAAGTAAAQASLGHANARTTTKHYVAGTAQQKQAAAAIDSLPKVKRKDDPRQKRLFD